MAGKYQIKTNGWNPKNTAWNSFQGIISKVGDNLYSLEGQMLKLKLQSFGHLMQRSDSLEKTHAGKDWRQEKGMTEDEMVGWHNWLNGHEFEQALGVCEGQESLWAAVLGVAKIWTWLNDWTIITTIVYNFPVFDREQGNTGMLISFLISWKKAPQEEKWFFDGFVISSDTEKCLAWYKPTATTQAWADVTIIRLVLQGKLQHYPVTRRSRLKWFHSL